MSGILSLVRPGILKLKPYVSARSLGAEGTVYLDANENPLPLYKDGPFLRVNRYPEPQPGRILQTAAALYGVAPERILVSRGSDEGIEVLTRALCEAGRDEVLICPPTYGVYEVAAGIQGAGVVRVPLVGAPDYRLDLRGIAKAIEQAGGRIKLVYVCSPNNPTGTLFDEGQIAEVCRLAAGNALVVVDEAYLEFSKSSGMLAGLGQLENLVVLRTLSKAWGLAGVRCGFTFAAPELIDVLQRVRAPYPMSSAAIQAIESVFTADGEARMRRSVRGILAEKAKLAAALQGQPGVETIFPSAANFLLVRVGRRDALLAAAKRAGVVVRDRSFDEGLLDCVRVTIGTREENEAALRCFREASA
ncbi:MAG: histidinol-phosphate transaminase [Proteobacteria bacterium]|nr:histidinol-phosphate transaminase [Pseudomonadota bacterium]